MELYELVKSATYKHNEYYKIYDCIYNNIMAFLDKNNLDTLNFRIQGFSFEDLLMYVQELYNTYPIFQNKLLEIIWNKYSFSSPSTITDSYWVSFSNKQLNNDIGKWLLFYSEKEIDYKWNYFCNVVLSGELDIPVLKCSTIKKPHLQNFVIILYCNNSNDKKHILNIGNQLKKNHLTDYPNDTIYYKTNEQTRNNRYLDTKCKNYLYKLR
jgi:hypothetical protein